MPVTLDNIPEQLRRRVSPDAPEPAKMMLAKAVMPMPPGDLFAVLAYLATTATGEIQATARKSLVDMPRSVLDSILKGLTSPELLDFALHEFVDDEKHVQTVLLNAATPDATIEWAARRLRGDLLELVGNNQERIVRHPAIAEAIYFNPEAPMALTTRVIETAIRNGVDLTHIRGYRQIYESIFGHEAGRKLDEANRKAEEAARQAAAAAKKIVAPIEPEELEPLPDLSEDDLAGDKPGIEAEVFAEVMRVATVDDSKLDPQSAESDVESRRIGKKPLHALIDEMNVPQKVRLALVGNKGARALLIKDSKAVVAMSVLKSPQITEGEISQYAKNKALSDRVISVICRNRDWTRSTAVQLSLIKHPKTPAAYTNRWVRGLGPRDLKEIARSRDVPGHVARLAKNLLQQRDQKSDKG